MRVLSRDLVALVISAVGSADGEEVRRKIEEFVMRLEEGETLEEIRRSLDREK